jgi:plastocyanin
MRTRRIALAALVAVTASATTVVAAEANSAHHGHTVVLKNIHFSPQKLTVKRGDSVTGAYEVTFKKPGLYRYHCTLHLGMTGSVRVR